MHKLRKKDLDIDNKTWHACICFVVITEEWATLKQSQNKAFIPRLFYMTCFQYAGL